jgi:homopolymeric O-antigen transport system permease protein
VLADLARLWRRRDVIEVLVSREMKARYRGAALGFLWSVVNPLIFMSVYVLVFSVYLRIEMENYPVFLLCGLLPWQWFNASVGESCRSIIDSPGLVEKVALPTEILPLVAVSSNLIHFLLSVPLLVALLLVMRIPVSWPILFFPLVVAVQLVFTFGVALIVSSLAVRFRDIVQLTPTLLTFFFFVTPVFYPSSMVPATYRPLILLNPMAHIIEAYHDVLLYRRPPDPTSFGAVALLAVALLAAGFAVFGARRDYFAEEV